MFTEHVRARRIHRDMMYIRNGPQPAFSPWIKRYWAMG